MTATNDLTQAAELMRSPPPVVALGDAEAIVRRFYGRDTKATPLSGERDLNLLVEDASGWSAILKFFNPADIAATRDLQHKAMRHIAARAPGCAVPALFSTLDGADEADVTIAGQTLAAVLISRLPGRNPSQQDVGPALRHSVGQALGQMLAALDSYDHPEAGRSILWDIMRADTLSPLCAFIADPARRRDVAAWLDRFATDILPVLHRLPHQVIHNDLSLSNVLVDPARRDVVTGVIDFGDIVRAPRVNDLAIAASYFIRDDDDLGAAAAQIVTGAASNIALGDEELAVMPGLIRTRLALRILVAQWRATLFPDNTAYLLRSNKVAWALWDRLSGQNDSQLADSITAHVKGASA